MVEATTAIRPGLCSITFRAEPAETIAAAAADAGLEAIEWGADVHAPDPRAAERVAGISERHGLAVASYGAYYRLGEDPSSFGHVLESAVAAGAPRIRVWAGRVERPAADTGAVTRAVDDARRIGDLAGAAGVRIGMEFHGGTLTATADSTVALLSDVAHRRVGTYWQPPVGMPDDDALAGLDAVAGWLEAVHVFSWWPVHQRRALADRAELWRRTFSRLGGIESVGLAEHRDALLEFVPDDDLALLAREAATLRVLIGGA